MAIKVEFETKIAKYRRINIPQPLFQVKTGDRVRVSIIVIEKGKNE